MEEIGGSSESEMVLAFVRAEYLSPDFSQRPQQVFAGDERFVDGRARTDDDGQNEVRKCALDHRGYRNREAIFTGFPEDLDWVRLVLTYEELGELRYLKMANWCEFSGGSLLVLGGAQNRAEHELNTKIGPIAEALESGQWAPKIPGIAWEFRCTHPELIIVSEHRPFTILEGHKRATAYHRVLPRETEFEVIAGYSSELGPWLRSSWR
jgi:hypothetical protein